MVMYTYLQANFVGGCLLPSLGEGGVDIIEAPARLSIIFLLKHARLNVEPHQLALELVDNLHSKS